MSNASSFRTRRARVKNYRSILAESRMADKWRSQSMTSRQVAAERKAVLIQKMKEKTR